MTPEEAMAIIREEGLERYVWFDKPSSLADAVAIHRDGEEWVVVMTDERGTLDGGVNRFESEGAALEGFIERLRLWNQVIASDERRNRRREERKRAARQSATPDKPGSKDEGVDVKPNEVSSLDDLRTYEESLGIWADDVGWADDPQVRREDGALHMTKAEDGSIELTPWSMSGPPRTKSFPDMRSAMQDIVSTHLWQQVAQASDARGVSTEARDFARVGVESSLPPREHVWSIIISDGWMHVGGMTMGRFRPYSTHETVDDAADTLARLVLTRRPSEPAPEGDLIAAGEATSQRILQRVDAEGGYARPAGVGPGDLLDRVGHESGSQLFALGTPFAWRSQPPDMVGAEYHRYRVLAQLPEAQEGRAAAWFDQPGGGAMIVAERPVRWYLDRGLLVEITDPA